MTTPQIVIVCVTALLITVAVCFAVIGSGSVELPKIVAPPGARVQVTKLDGQALRGQLVVTGAESLILEQVDIVDRDGTTTATGGRWHVPLNRIEAIQEL